MAITISIPKASIDEIERGLLAAMAVFDAAGVDPITAATGQSKRLAWDIDGFEYELPDDVFKAAAAWDDADSAALEAVCGNWAKGRKRPDSARLALLRNPETQLIDRAGALKMLHQIVGQQKGQKKKYLDTRVGELCVVVAADLENQSFAGRLIDAITISFTTLEMAYFYPEEPIEPKRQAVMDAIDALERATA